MSCVGIGTPGWRSSGPGASTVPQPAATSPPPPPPLNRAQVSPPPPSTTPPPPQPRPPPQSSSLVYLHLLFNRLSYKSKLESLHKKTMVRGRKMFISQLFSTESLLIQMFLSQRSYHCLGSAELIFSDDPHDLFPASLEPFLVQQRSASSWQDKKSAGAISNVLIFDVFVFDV